MFHQLIRVIGLVFYCDSLNACCKPFTGNMPCVSSRDDVVGCFCRLSRMVSRPSSDISWPREIFLGIFCQFCIEFRRRRSNVAIWLFLGRPTRIWQLMANSWHTLHQILISRRPPQTFRLSILYPCFTHTINQCFFINPGFGLQQHDVYRSLRG